MNNTKAVVLENNDGYKLFGIVHEPKKQVSNTGIIILPPGVKMRVAPHRLYVTMAQEFSNMGFFVLRIDFNGMGDSEGSHPDIYLSDLYNKVQDGHFVEDAISAMDWMEKNENVDSFILSGLCGGAITGLLASKNDSRVEGVLGLGLPIVFEPSEEDRHKHLTKGQLDNYRTKYVKKIFSIKSWSRVLLLKSDFKTIFEVIKKMVGGKKKKLDKPSQNITEAGVANSNINPKFPPAFFNMVKRSGKVLLIFSGADRLQWDFEEKFYEPNKTKIDKYDEYFEVHSIKDANHIFSENRWKDEMLNISKNWLARY